MSADPECFVERVMRPLEIAGVDQLFDYAEP